MLKIGCHLSVARGYTHMGEEALRIDANTFQFFSRNPRGSQSRAFDPKDLAGLAKILADHAFAPVLGHAPYTMNPCAADPGLMDLARQMMTGDLARLDALPGQLYDFHPGSHVGQGVATVSARLPICSISFSGRMARRPFFWNNGRKGSEVGSTLPKSGDHGPNPTSAIAGCLSRNLPCLCPATIWSMS
jgi:deoxyribonuclease-4